MVVWNSTQGNDASSIYLRRFDNQGDPISGDLRINQQYAGQKLDPSVVELDNGNLVVTWQLENDWSGISSTIVKPDNSMTEYFVVKNIRSDFFKHVNRV